MRVQSFCENTWLYPDMPGAATEQTDQRIALDAARGGTVGFQILGDASFDSEVPFRFAFRCGGGIACVPYQLLPARVEENSGAKLHTTLDYDSVAEFVTRRAPFDVYDVTRDLDAGVAYPGRAAFYFLLRVPPDAEPGAYAGELRVTAGQDSFTVTADLTVHQAQVPQLADAAFSMVNWIFPQHIASQHQVEEGSDQYLRLLRAYMEHQLDMRTDHLMLPSGTPLRQNGRVVDFGFAAAEVAGNMALEAGYRCIYGGFVARFEDWQDADQRLLWDRQVTVTSEEGYRQLKVYFARAWETVVRHGWQDRYMQCMVDEPQFPNSMSYRALAAICRKWMPGVTIHDPVESADLEGAVDIWCVKQAVYEQHLARFQRLQALGETLWVYTCGFPAGKTMNRVLDLPLLAGRLPMWLCLKYGFKGFLHWGYNAHTGDPFMTTCFDAGSGRKLPPGNGFVVYPGDGRPWYSVRGHLQRAGAEDFELLAQLAVKDRDAALRLVGRVCESFDAYDPDPANFARVRRDLLRAVSR